MTRYFSDNPINYTWPLGCTISELLTIPIEYGTLAGGVPRCHIRGAQQSSPLLLVLGVADDASSTGFTLDEGARTLLLFISAKDTYELTGGSNIPLIVHGDIELRFGVDDSAIVQPIGIFQATIQDRWTYFFDTDAA